MSRQPAISPAVAQLLRDYAERYETADFLVGDPSWWMHQVDGDANREATAFVAANLSYGSRQQFMRKIQAIVDWADGDVDAWVRRGDFTRHLPPGDGHCFYRLYTCGAMHDFLNAYRLLLTQWGTLGDYVRQHAADAPEALDAICRHFAQHGSGGVVPKDTQSACKRLCMFLRWMVRDGSPVDLGLWASWMPRESLVMPLDTHVVSQATRLQLLTCRTASMSAARRLTEALATVFPGDPLRGDFALFGYGVNNK